MWTPLGPKLSEVSLFQEDNNMYLYEGVGLGQVS